jgi:hypothetical protein
MNMNLKHLRVYTKNTLLVVLATIVLAGATGLSYTSHYCHGHLSGIAFYTELGLQKAASCGCKDDGEISKTKSSSSSTVAFRKNACCSNISVFSKLDIESLANDLSAAVPLQPEEVTAVFNITYQLTSVTKYISVSDFGFRPPPLAGRKLVLFLSQQRIPLISYSC